MLLPVGVSWLMGVYDAWARRSTQRELRTASGALCAALGERVLTTGERQALLDGLGREHKVFVRLLDCQGRRLQASDPAPGEGRIWGTPVFERMADFFFGPEGPPDLATSEQSLPPEGERPEVRAALADGAGEAFRGSESAKMHVFYRAVTTPSGDGILYLSRISRRSVRALYALRYQMLKLTLLQALVGALLALWVGWHIVLPLSRIQRAVRAYLDTGAAVSLKIQRSDEIGDLSRDFDELAGRLQQRIAQSSQVAADLAHDLKSPLSAIVASAELLQAGNAIDGERRRRIAEAISQSASHMSRSVTALLTLARLDESLSREAREVVPVAELVVRVCQAFQHDPRHAHIRLAVEAASAPRLLGVPEQLAQAVHNLIDNAAAFCRETIVVRVTGPDPVVIAVMDDGPGVSPGNRDKIFTRFFSVRPPGREPGSGLGLAIVATVAQAHGGGVELAESCELGGACFRIVLPRP